MLHAVVVAFSMPPVSCCTGQVARRCFVLPASRSLLRAAVLLDIASFSLWMLSLTSKNGREAAQSVTA
jgi:hypothetical protein